MYKKGGTGTAAVVMCTLKSSWVIFDRLPHGLLSVSSTFPFSFKSKNGKWSKKKKKWRGENEKECETPLENIIATLKDFHCEFIVVKSTAFFLFVRLSFRAWVWVRVCDGAWDASVCYLIFNVSEKKGNFIAHENLHLCACYLVAILFFYITFGIFQSLDRIDFDVSPNWASEVEGPKGFTLFDAINILWKHFICVFYWRKVFLTREGRTGISKCDLTGDLAVPMSLFDGVESTGRSINLNSNVKIFFPAQLLCYLFNSLKEVSRIHSLPSSSAGRSHMYMNFHAIKYFYVSLIFIMWINQMSLTRRTRNE